MSMPPPELLPTLRICFGTRVTLHFGGAEIVIGEDCYTIEADRFELAFSDGEDSFVGSLVAFERWCDDLSYVMAVAQQDECERQLTPAFRSRGSAVDRALGDDQRPVPR
jgi:hypothetical protein